MSQNIWSAKEKNEADEREEKEQKLPEKLLEKGHRKEEMDAENADRYLRPLENYIGVFSPKSLNNIKIVAYPAAVLVLTDGHWISFYITKQSLEIMDSMGYLGRDDFDENLRKFITAHATAKTVSTTPQLQTTQSNLCALYAICFLYYRAFDCGTLCDFCNIFRPNLTRNNDIIRKLFALICEIK